MEIQERLSRFANGELSFRENQYRGHAQQSDAQDPVPGLFHRAIRRVPKHAQFYNVTYVNRDSKDTCLLSGVLFGSYQSYYVQTSRVPFRDKKNS